MPLRIASVYHPAQLGWGLVVCMWWANMQVATGQFPSSMITQPGGGLLKLPSGNAPAANAGSLAAPASSAGSGLRPSAALITSQADNAPTGISDAPLTPERIAAETAAVEARSDLDAEVKKELLERLGRAAKWLQDELEWIRRKTELEAQLAAVPELTKAAQAELAKPSQTPAVEFPPTATLTQLEAKLAELRHQLEADEAVARSKEEETENRLKRLSEISKEMSDTEKRVAEAKQQLAALTDPDFLTQTKQIEQRARIRGRQQQLLMLKAEQLRLEAVTELLPLQRDLARRTASNTKKLLQAWQTAVDKWRKEESRRQAAEARRVAENSHPALRSLAEKNAEIAEQRIQTAAGIERLAKTIKAIKEKSTQFAERFEELQNKVQHASATSSTGVLLLKQRDELPRQEEFLEQSTFVHNVMPEAHLKLLEFSQLRRDMSDPAEMAAEMLSSFSKSLAGYDQQQVLEVVTGLLTDRRDFLEKAVVDQDRFLRDLNELELANQALADQVQEFRQYLDQRVMWIRSAEPLSYRDLQQAVSGLMALSAPARWLEVLRVSGGELLRRPAGAIAVISLFMLLLLGRARLLTIQNRLTTPIAADQPASYWPNLAAMLIAVVLSTRWPLLLLAIGCRLQFASSATPWTQAVGHSCLMTMLFLWGWELLREICRRGGLGETLFHWPGKATSAIRNSLELTLLLGIPLLSLLQLSQFGELAGLKGLERSLFVLVMMLCALQYAILLRPRGRMMNSLRSDDLYAQSIFVKARIPIWIISVSAPVGLAGLSAAGYHFSAYQLSARMTETSAAIVAVLLVHHIFLSWLDVKAHNFLLHQPATDPAAIQTKRAAFHFVGEDGEDGDETDEATLATPLVQSQLKSYQEFRDLLRYVSIIALLFSGWFIWDSVLPALRVLDQVELWKNLETVAESVVDKDGYETILTNQHSVPTTLTDVLLAVAVVFGTLTVSARLPGLLQLTILERLPLDHGGRQAIAILVRYGVTLMGLLVACHIIRVSWSSVQWLAAAMTVGLGFGLQEIFANLVSGLIILFERPIRLGDLVTVGQVTGNVTRMQMRATTITDFDRREMIVPNKTFITDNVINWTLSDPISRVVLPVGVAINTDVPKAQAVLLRIARRCPFVMQEPPPTTLFKGFGDSTLNLELRVFIPRRDLYLEVVNELNSAIVREFARYHIQIAFPQRDLHIRTVDSLKPLFANSDAAAEKVFERRTAG